MLSPAELRRIGNNIITDGLKVPIILYTPGVCRGEEGEGRWLIDGRTRLAGLALVLNDPEEFAEHVDAILNGTYNARKELQKLYSGSGAHRVDDEDVRGDIKGYIDSLNLHRRHLTNEQKREMIAALRKAQPEKSDNAIAKEVGASPTTVSKVTKELEVKGDVSKLETRTDTKGRQQPATKRSGEPKVDNKIRMQIATDLYQRRQQAPAPSPIAPPPRLPERHDPAELRSLLQPVTVTTEERTPPPIDTIVRFDTGNKPSLPPELKKPVAEARAEALIQLSALLSLDPHKTVDEILRVLRDARSRILEIPKEKRISHARGFLRALNLTDADLRPIG